MGCNYSVGKLVVNILQLTVGVGVASYFYGRLIGETKGRSSGYTKGYKDGVDIGYKIGSAIDVEYSELD